MSRTARSYDWVGCLLIIASVLSCSAVPSLARAAELNVLFIAVDDFRPEIGAYGVEEIRTPNIDALAQEGMLFSRAYAQMAVCGPSRTSLLTGLRPDGAGVTDNQTHFRSTVPGVVTLPQWFKQNGYQTQGICKVFHGGLDDSESWTRPALKGSGPPAPLGPDGKVLAFAAVDRPDSDFGDYKCADHAIQSINELRDVPFFIAVGFNKPHLPFLAPTRFYDLYDRETLSEAVNGFRALDAPSFAFGDMRELRRNAYYSQIPPTGPFDEALRRGLKHGYYAAASFVDAQVGRILAELEAAGLSQNTLVVLWGDHGYHLGEQADWGKDTNFEVGTRVPVIFRGPGVPMNASSSALVELVDLYPTIAQLAGLPMPSDEQRGGYPFQGDNLVPLIQDPSLQSRRGAFSQWLRKGWDGRSIRTDRYRFTEWTRLNNKVYELYDHEDDPLETVNQASNPYYASVLPVLKAALAAGGQVDLPIELTSANRVPTVAIVSPADGSTLMAGAPIALAASTSDPDGDTVTVTWTANGDPVAEPWSPDPGTYTVVATAEDGRGGSASDSVAITVEGGAPGVFPSIVHAIGANASRAPFLLDTVNDEQNLSTAWSNNGDVSTSWFTLDLGSQRTVSEIRIAPTGVRSYNLTIAMGDSLSDGRVSAPAAGACSTPGGGSDAPAGLRNCPVSGQGRYVTVQANRPWFKVYGVEVIAW